MKTIVKPTSIRLEPKILKELDSLSKNVHRPKTWIIKEAIRYYLDEKADLDIALEKITDPNTDYVDWEEVKDELLNKAWKNSF